MRAMSLFTGYGGIDLALKGNGRILSFESGGPGNLGEKAQQALAHYRENIEGVK